MTQEVITINPVIAHSVWELLRWEQH